MSPPMSLSATAAAMPHEPAESRKLLLLIWGVTVATYLFTGRGADQGLSTDDAMRLVRVRDLIAGQGWFDVTQYRLNPPAGVALHWSRLIDLPIAILLRAAELALPSATAERLVLTVWPAGLLLALLFGVARIARELADDSAARLALIFAAVTAPLLQHFRPGAIDHHSVQLVLMLWSVALLIRERASVAVQKFAIPSGQNGSELLNREENHAGRPSSASVPLDPKFATECAAESSKLQDQGRALATQHSRAHSVRCRSPSARRWRRRLRASPDSSPCAGSHAANWPRDTAAAFGMAFAAGTLALFIATVPPARYTAATCDAFSIVQVVTAVTGGFGLAILTAWRALSTVRKRVAGAAGLGELLGAIVAIGFPACLGNPYADLDPRLAALWLSNVNEARSIAGMMRDVPQEVLPYYGLPVIALALGLYRCRHEDGARQWGWIGATAVMAIVTLVAIWQVRGGSAANAIAVAIAAAALVRGFRPRRAAGVPRSRTLHVRRRIASQSDHIGGDRHGGGMHGRSSLRRATAGGGLRRTRHLSLAADYAPLARLPRGLVLGFVDAGPRS